MHYKSAKCCINKIELNCELNGVHCGSEYKFLVHSHGTVCVNAKFNKYAQVFLADQKLAFEYAFHFRKTTTGSVCC